MEREGEGVGLLCCRFQGRVWSQLWPVTLRLRLGLKPHRLNSQGVGALPPWGQGSPPFFPPMDPVHSTCNHTQTWTEIFATTAQLSPAKYTIQQVRHSPSDSSSKGNTPLSLAQAQVWVQVQALMWPAVSQSSALAKSKSLVCLLARPAKAQLVPGTAAGCSETMKGVTGVCPFREACHCAIVSLDNPNPLQGALQARRWCMSFDDLIIQHPSEHSLGAAIHTCH